MTDMTKDINLYFTRVTETLGSMDRESIVKFVDMLVAVCERGGTVYTCGNGGSGATASHLCCDLMQIVPKGVERKLKAICLNDNMPRLLAVANDISYESVFVEPLRDYLTDRDLLVVISGSGNSRNIVKAIDYANEIGVPTVAICGYKGGYVKEASKLAIHADVDDMEVSEDIHMIVSHCVKQMLIGRLREPAEFPQASS